MCKTIVKHLMGLPGAELTESQSAALIYAYRRCGFVSLDKKQRFGNTVERVYALRNSEKWNNLIKTDSGVQLMRAQIEKAIQGLPMTDKEKKALGDSGNWGAAFERLLNATDATPGSVAVLPLVAAIL